MKAPAKSISKVRYLFLITGFLVVAIIDFFCVPLTDIYPTERKGYQHSTGAFSTDPYYDVLYGSGRVVFNFRHFGHWWTAWPLSKGLSPMKLVVSDGNSMVQNVGGHFVLSFILSLIAIFLVPRPVLVCALGTFMNIFHEYITEGHYCDPSFIDLWLSQLGLVLAIAFWLCAKRRKPTGTEAAGQPSMGVLLK